MNDFYLIWRKVIITTRAVADPGEGSGGVTQVVFLHQTEARKAEKKTPPPPHPLPEDLDAPL